jgi:hypothetical protein
MIARKYFRCSLAGMMILIAIVAGLLVLVTPRAAKWTIYQATAIDLSTKNITHFDATVKIQDLEVKEVEDKGSQYAFTVVMINRRSGKIHRANSYISRAAIEAFHRQNPSYELPSREVNYGPN